MCPDITRFELDLSLSEEDWEHLERGACVEIQQRLPQPKLFIKVTIKRESTFPKQGGVTITSKG